MPPRVAHVISSRAADGGAERFLVALIEEGSRRGWQQLVLKPFSSDPSPQSAAMCPSIPCKVLPGDPIRSLPSVRRSLRAELSRFAPDLTHTLLFPATALMATVPAGPGEIRLLTNVYGEALRALSYPRVRTVVDRWAGRRFDRIAAISESVERHLVSQYRFPASKVTCIPLGWEGEPLPSTADDRHPTVVCLAGLRSEKNHALLLDAFALVRREMPSARLLLVGDGELRGDIERRIRELDLTSSVEITGVVPEVWPYLARGHVFALASRSEAYGIALAEAMAAGLPVVASAVGGIPELVVPGVTGELFAPDDCHLLATHLLRLLKSPDLRSRMGEAARERAQHLHMRERISLYGDLCESLLAVCSPPRPVR